MMTMVDINNAVINNNLRKTPKPKFALQNSHKPAKGFLRRLWTIWARVLKTSRQPWSRLRLLCLKKEKSAVMSKTEWRDDEWKKKTCCDQ